MAVTMDAADNAHSMDAPDEDMDAPDEDMDVRISRSSDADANSTTVVLKRRLSDVLNPRTRVSSLTNVAVTMDGADNAHSMDAPDEDMDVRMARSSDADATANFGPFESGEGSVRV
jgi:P pilus assembly chaperone PapD